jgi:large subunit ribosomal protein L15
MKILNKIGPGAGAKTAPKRLGRGIGSGLGKTAGRGHKGQTARAGGYHKVGFEGGQMPIQRRTPKRGFKPIDRVRYQVLTAGSLAAAPAGTTVDRAWLEAKRLVRRRGPIKLLAGGELAVAVTLQVDAASASGRAQVERAGGRVELTAKPAGEAAQRATATIQTKTKAKKTAQAKAKE